MFDALGLGGGNSVRPIFSLLLFSVLIDKSFAVSCLLVLESSWAFLSLSGFTTKANPCVSIVKVNFDQELNSP